MFWIVIFGHSLTLALGLDGCQIKPQECLPLQHCPAASMDKTSSFSVSMWLYAMKSREGTESRCSLYYVVDESWFLIHCIISNGKIYLIRKSSLLSTCFQIMHSWKCVVCKLRHITPDPKNTIFQSSLACTFASKNIMVLALWSNEKHIHGKWLEVYKSLEYGIKSNMQYSIDFYKLALFDSNEILT